MRAWLQRLRIPCPRIPNSVHTRDFLGHEKRTNIIDDREFATSNTRGVAGMDDWWLVVVKAGWGLFPSPAAERYWETFLGLMICKGYQNIGQVFNNQQVN